MSQARIKPEIFVNFRPEPGPHPIRKPRSDIRLCCIVLQRKHLCCYYDCQQLTGEDLLVSRAKEAINVNGLVPDLVRINQYQTLATSDYTMTEAYELLKNMHFLDDPCSIQAFIKKRQSNADLEGITNWTNFAIAPTTYAL